MTSTRPSRCDAWAAVAGSATKRNAARETKLALALALASGVLACEREKGPLEKAGVKVDEVVDDSTHPGEGPVAAGIASLICGPGDPDQAGESVSRAAFESGTEHILRMVLRMCGTRWEA